MRAVMCFFGTRSGDILGACQCIPVDIALKSITLGADDQHY